MLLRLRFSLSAHVLKYFYYTQHTIQDFTCLTGVAIFISPVTDKIFTLLFRHLCLHFLKRMIHVTLKHYPRCPEYYQLEKRWLTEICFRMVWSVCTPCSFLRILGMNVINTDLYFPSRLWIFDCKSYRALWGVLFIWRSRMMFITVLVLSSSWWVDQYVWLHILVSPKRKFNPYPESFSFGTKSVLTRSQHRFSRCRKELN